MKEWDGYEDIPCGGVLAEAETKLTNIVCYKSLVY